VAAQIMIHVDAHPLTLVQQTTQAVIGTQQVRVGREVQTRRVKTGETTTETTYEPEHGLQADQVRAYIDAANVIWRGAAISFKLREHAPMRYVLPVSHTLKATVDTSVFDKLAVTYPGKAGFRLFLVRSLQTDDAGDLGVATDQYGVCALAKIPNVVDAGKVLAHEFGHLLGLDHYSPREGATTTARNAAAAKRAGNLMAAGLARGTKLEAEQVATARKYKVGM
jgi:hypothetical protein